MSPYLNHLAAERRLLRSTEVWKTSASFACDLDKISHTCSLVGSRWSCSSASWIFLVCTLTCTLSGGAFPSLILCYMPIFFWWRPPTRGPTLSRLKAWATPLPKLVAFQLSLFHLWIGKSQNNEIVCQVCQTGPIWIGLRESGQGIFGSKRSPQFSRLSNPGLGKRGTYLCVRLPSVRRIFRCRRWIPLRTFPESCQTTICPLSRIGVLGGATQSPPFCASDAYQPPLRAQFLPSGWNLHLGWSDRQLDSLHSTISTSTLSHLKSRRHKHWWLSGYRYPRSEE